MRKGIILAGGSGTRLSPLTDVVCKQLLPVYNKPMIYYPMSVLLLAGIRDILIISNKEDIALIRRLFDKNDLEGVNISYAVQEAPRGIAEAFIIGEEFIGKDSVALILGDNLFYGEGFTKRVKKVNRHRKGATIFAYPTKDPNRFGIVEVGKGNKAISIEEKPSNPKSNLAVPGLYFYDNSVVSIAKNLTPSARGELEITDINKQYMKQGKLRVEILGRGFTWFDMGTFESLYDATSYVRSIKELNGHDIGQLKETMYEC